MSKKTTLGPGATPGRRYLITPKGLIEIPPTVRTATIATEDRTSIISKDE